MPRKFPRFLFSNPVNTKTKGPFIMHLLNPIMVFKVHSKTKLEIVLSQAAPEEEQTVTADAIKWLQFQDF